MDLLNAILFAYGPTLSIFKDCEEDAVENKEMVVASQYGSSSHIIHATAIADDD